jgi:hypothetical protein
MIAEPGESLTNTKPGLSRRALAGIANPANLPVWSARDVRWLCVSVHAACMLLAPANEVIE